MKIFVLSSFFAGLLAFGAQAALLTTAPSSGQAKIPSVERIQVAPFIVDTDRPVYWR